MTLPSLADVLTAVLTEAVRGYEDADRWVLILTRALLPPLQAREQTLREELDKIASTLGLEIIEDRWCAIGEDGPIDCDSISEAVAEYNRLCENEVAAAEARVSSLTAEREALKVDRDALMDRVSDMIDEREALQEALAKAKRTKP